MSKIIKNSLGDFLDFLYPVFRILVGLMFFQHGAQKIMGVLGGLGGSGEGVPDIISLLGMAGIIELIGGALITLGVFTRLVALIAAIEMAVAYFMVHFPNGFYPVLNGGELAVLYFSSFLVMIARGAKKWSLEKIFVEKEIF